MESIFFMFANLDRAEEKQKNRLLTQIHNKYSMQYSILYNHVGKIPD